MARSLVFNLVLEDERGVLGRCLGSVSVGVDARRNVVRRRKNLTSSSAFPISSRASLTGGVGLALGMFEINSGLFPCSGSLQKRAKEKFLSNSTGAGTMYST